MIYKIGLDEPNLILVLHILCIGTLPLRSIEFSKIINLICIASEERRQEDTYSQIFIHGGAQYVIL